MPADDWMLAQGTVEFREEERRHRNRGIADQQIQTTASGKVPNDYRLWVNLARTVLVRMWASGLVEVALRDHPSHTWGPPIVLDEEKVS